MDYYYRPAGQHIEYRDGCIIFVDEFSGESCSQRIGKIVVTMEEKENEIGIRIITECSIYDSEDNLLCEDNQIIAKNEYNYSNDKDDAQIVCDLERKYNVSAQIVGIEIR